MSDSSPATAPRPVTPLGIVASDLEDLREWAGALSDTDSAFVERLERAGRLASGLEAYLAASTTPESTALTELAAETARLDWTRLYAAGETGVALEREMLSGHVEGQLLKMLVRVARATRVLEIGLFTGYSALAMAEALPADGRLLACELDRYAAGVARRGFDRSPHGAKIDVAVGPAIDTLRRLRDERARFDFIFIDADKGGYADYFELVVGSTLLSDDGLLCVDNTLMQGEPYAAESPSPNGRAIAAFNRLVAADPRVEQVLLPIRDGLTLIRRASS